MIRKLTSLILIALCLFAPCQAAKLIGQMEGETQFVGYLNHDEYTIQTDNEISFIYKDSDGQERKYDKVPVFPSGTIIIPEYKETYVLDMNSSDLKELIKTKLNLETIDIFIYRVANNISVLGEVNSPGSYNMKDIKTIYDGIAKAGGFSKVAKQSKVKLIRQKLDGTRISYEINFPKEVFKAYEPGSGVGQEIFLIKEGDLIFVPGSIPKKSWELLKKAISAATFGVFTALVGGMID